MTVDERLGAIATALYDTFETARLAEHPEDVPAYRQHAETFKRWLAIHDFRVSASTPAAWLHTMHMELGQVQRRLTLTPDNPFGLAGRDYDQSYLVESEPLFRGDKAP